MKATVTSLFTPTAAGRVFRPFAIVSAFLLAAGNLPAQGLPPLSLTRPPAEELRGSPNSFRKSNVRGPEEDLSSETQEPGEVRMGIRSINIPEEFRTIDGSGNNTENPEWGSTEIPFLRLTTVDYADGVDAPAGENRVSAREISNAVAAQETLFPNRWRVSDFFWQWGQFIDHDIVLTPVADPVEPFDIDVPAGDPFFDPDENGDAIIEFDRSFHETVDGVREQFNEITAFIDASSVYGSDTERALALRTRDGTGQLATSEGDLLPFNADGLPNAPADDAPDYFLAGDFRANEQVALSSLHTLFVREHNYWAQAIQRSNSELTGDQIYESARVIVAAEMQVITYREFLPLLLGRRAIPPYEGYQSDVNPGIGNAFATAAYRVGHTMLASRLLRLDRRRRAISEGHLDLAEAFFNPSALIDEGGIEPVLRGLAYQPAQEIDNRLVDDVRNFLFGSPDDGGFDLAALNIQRGRDHGLPSYNQARIDLGLEPIDDFSDITRDRHLQDRLESVYEDVNDIDLWVGGLAEPPFRDAMVGETFFTILRDQFLRLRDGDRFWYQNYFDRELQRLVERQTLAQIIRRNTEIGREISDNVFITRFRPVPETEEEIPTDEPPRGGPGPRPGGGRPPRGR